MSRKHISESDRKQTGISKMKDYYEEYIRVLKSELIPALGCTEPIAVALAAAKAREVLGGFPEHIGVSCSTNILKNVKSVTVPNSAGLKGIKAAAILGAKGGCSRLALKVLDNVSTEDVEFTREMLDKPDFCECSVADTDEPLYIRIDVRAGADTACVVLEHEHTHFSRVEKNGAVVPMVFEGVTSDDPIDKSFMTVEGILDFADNVDLERVRETIDRQISMNTAIAKAGMAGEYGCCVGKNILRQWKNAPVEVRAGAYAAAGSDARMGGCPLPVIINSGSGNQGMTVSVPLVVYAEEFDYSTDSLRRALLVSNLIAIHQKSAIGSLSAYCGAVSAGCAAACGAAYLTGGSYNEICDTIGNCLGAVGGIVCDGAKASCAAKIATSVTTALMGLAMARNGYAFSCGDGLIGKNVEDTIARFAQVAKDGMYDTDRMIAGLMLGNS